MIPRPLRVLFVVVALVGAAAASTIQASATDGALDPAHNVALPCESLATPGLVPRSAKNVAHVANVCGFVGTDVEFQSRRTTDGVVHDYAFLGTMGAGLRIFDVTTPGHPTIAGSYTDPGWQNDVQVRGDLAVIGFDPISAVNPSTSACLQAKGARGGIDLVRLAFDATAGTFTTSLLGCVDANPSGGAHNATIHPSGQWLAMINPRTNGSIDVVDLRGAPKRIYRLVQDATLTNAACTTLPAEVRCISIGRAGTWSPHDVSFSRDGRTAYVAAVTNDTLLVDVRRVLDGVASVISVIPNDNEPGGLSNPRNVDISHQSDTTSDGRVLMLTDERGGGVGNTSCNTDPNGVIGGMGFWALARFSGRPDTAKASPAKPVKLGTWLYPNPTLAVDPLEPILASLPRAERGCTIHVFRAGGNGTAGPGAIASGFDGVSRLPKDQLVTAHYGAGVWHLSLAGPPTGSDGITEDARSTWGNTLGWNVMPGADTWSAKEYKGHIYAGDMARGFDVYRITACDGAGCVLAA